MIYEKFVLTNIYILLLVNSLVLSSIVVYKLVYGWRKKRIAARVQHLLPAVKEEMDRIVQGMEPDCGFLLSRWRRRYVYRAMLQVVKDSGQDYHLAFDRLGFTSSIIHTIATRSDYTDLRAIWELSLIKSPLANDILLAQIGAHNVEKAYRAAHVLAGMKLNDEEAGQLVEAVLTSSINRERQVELLNRLKPAFSVLLHCLQVENNEKARTILLLAIKDHPDLPGNLQFLELMRPFLYASIDVSIAAVEVVSTIAGDDAFELVASCLDSCPPWEVRARIARILLRFPGQGATELLKNLSQDESWWVRFNALNSLGKLGQRGLDIILDLALNSKNGETASQAYQMLNASADVFNTLNNLEKEQNPSENPTLGL